MQTMASKGKKSRAKWDSEVKRKLIDIWADIIEEFDGKLHQTSYESLKKSDTRLQVQEKVDEEEHDIHGSHFPLFTR